MTLLRQWVYVEADDSSGTTRKFGSRDQPLVLSGLTGNVVNIDGTSVTTNVITLISATINAYLVPLKHFAFTADQNASLEFVGTTTADDSNLTLLAGGYFVIAGTQTRAYNASGSFAGSLENITIIRYRNDGGSTANFRCLAGS